MSELTREQCLEQEIARLTLRIREINKDHMEMSVDRAKTVKDNKELRAQLAACENELPDTWYVDKPLGERLAMLIIQWQKALRINTELEQQLAAMTKELETWKFQADMSTKNEFRLTEALTAAQATIAGYRNTVNIYTEQFQRLESRTARLKEALEKLLTQVLGEGMDMTAAIEQAQQQAIAEDK